MIPVRGGGEAAEKQGLLPFLRRNASRGDRHYKFL